MLVDKVPRKLQILKTVVVYDDFQTLKRSKSAFNFSESHMNFISNKDLILIPGRNPMLGLYVVSCNLRVINNKD